MRSLVFALLFAACAAVPVDGGSNPEPVLAPAERVYLRGEIDAESTAKALAQMQGKHEIVLVISNVGGSVLDGMWFIEDVEDLRAKGLVVHCVADIVVASMAANILESPACGDRVATARTVLVFHKVQSPPSELVNKVDQAIAEMVAPRLGLLPAAYLAKLAQGDWVMTAAEALAAHAIDRIE